MVGIYTRVSTGKQAKDDRYSLTVQQNKGIEFASKNKEEYRVYSDVISGSTVNRPALDKLLLDISSGEITSLWTIETSRISRGDMEIWGSIIKILKNADASLYIADEKKDLNIWFPNDWEEFREPFCGGASVTLYQKQLHPERKFWINDIDDTIVNFWIQLRDNTQELITSLHKGWNEGLFHDVIEHQRLQQLVDDSHISSLDRAVILFILSKTSFRGDRRANFILPKIIETNIDKLNSVAEILQGIKITNKNYIDILKEEGHNVFYYFDPPYFGTEYNYRCCQFDHQLFYHSISQLTDRWFLSYNDNEVISKLYQDFEQYCLQELWGVKKGTKYVMTLLISNFSKQKELIV